MGKVIKEKENNKSTEPTKEIIDLTRRLVEIDNRYEEASKLKKQLDEEGNKLRYELIDKMQTLGLENFRTKEFGLISITNRFFAKITDMQSAEKWLLENGLHDEILKLEARTMRLNELIQKRLEDGLSVPPGIDYSVTKRISHRIS